MAAQFFNNLHRGLEKAIIFQNISAGFGEIFKHHSAEEFIKYEEHIHTKFHSLRTRLLNYFVHRYSWILDKLPRNTTTQSYGSLSNPTDILKLTYRDFLTLFHMLNQ